MAGIVGRKRGHQRCIACTVASHRRPIIVEENTRADAYIGAIIEDFSEGFPVATHVIRIDLHRANIDIVAESLDEILRFLYGNLTRLGIIGSARGVITDRKR